MSRRLIGFVALALFAAAVCICMGFWQLDRLAQRRHRNALATTRVAQPTVALSSLPADSASRLRRARVTGTPDYAHELVLAPRSFEGSPGVHLVTPLRIAGRDTAVLVVRGWVYAPDAITVDRARWRERDSAFVGYAELMTPSEPARGEVVLREASRVLRRLHFATVRRVLPYPVSPLYLVATNIDSATPPNERVARLSPPPIDDGPHLGYALQWFSFATIAVVGSAVVVARTRGAERARTGNGRLAGY